VDFVIIVAMLAVNAVFASYEMALASVSRARLEVLLLAKRQGASSAVYMKDRMEGSLAVVQLGITLSGAIAAATGGAAVDEALAPMLVREWGLSARAAEALALGVLVIPLSAVTIVFAELVPKMVGINNKEWVVLRLSPAMRIVAGLFRPAVYVFETAVKFLMRLGKGVPVAHAPDQAGLLELRAAAALARATRIIGPMEERIVVSAAQLSARRVSDAMVPAKEITTIPFGASLADALIVAHTNMRTRYPVCRVSGDPDSIEGYVTFKDIVGALKIDPLGRGLPGIVRPIRRIGAETTLAQALTEMIRDRIHIALVADGTRVCGLLTLEDIVEELVGDIHDEYDRLPAHIHRIGDGWLVGGGAALGDLAKAMGVSGIGLEDEKMTLAEWGGRAKGAVVRGGDFLQLDGAEVLVRKARRNRVFEAIVRSSCTPSAKVERIV